MCMQFIMSEKSATISLLLMVIFATIFFRAVFFVELFLSFFVPLANSIRSSATLPCEVLNHCELTELEEEEVTGVNGRNILMIGVYKLNAVVNLCGF